MGGRHGTSDLHRPGTSAVHRAPGAAKVAATVLFAFAVVATPRQAVWAFGLHGLGLLAVVGAARLPASFVLRRLRIEVPFLAFAAFMPFVGSGPEVEVLGQAVSEPGLWAAWAITVKGTLGVVAAIVLAATTSVPELLVGLERLRVPRSVVAITGFMVRYLDVIGGEAARMRVARLSRASDPRWLWQARALAASGGTLFVRSYERGERVHLAMCSRGYAGSMPPLRRPAGTVDGWRGWAAALAVPAAAALVAVAAGTVS